MPRSPISVTIITLNEEKNIARAVASVQWADEILVIDSGSTDHTVEIAKKGGARVIANPWPGYGAQKNFAQRQAKHDWVLNLDADEAVSPELAREIQNSVEAASSGKDPYNGFAIPRRTFFLNRWIRHGGWYPNYITRLADRKHAQWTEPHVHEDLKIQGSVGRLGTPIDHYAFPRIQDQILTNLHFSYLGSQDLVRRGQRPSILKLLIKPLGKFVETYLLKFGFLDGLAGFIISVNAAHSMFLKYAFLFQSDTKEKQHENSDHRQQHRSG